MKLWDVVLRVNALAKSVMGKFGQRGGGKKGVEISKK